MQTRITCFRLWEKEVTEGGLSEGTEMAKRMMSAALLREILFLIYMRQEVYQKLTLNTLSAGLVNLSHSFRGISEAFVLVA